MASQAKYMASQARCSPLSHHPPLYGLLVAEGASLGQLIHIVCLYTQVYGISGQVYDISGKISPFVPSCPPPCTGYWWLMVLARDNWSILSACLHKYMACQAKYMASEARCPPLSHHAPPVWVIVGQWYWPGTIGLYCLPMYTSIWHLRPSKKQSDAKMSPFVPLCPPVWVIGSWWCWPGIRPPKQTMRGLHTCSCPVHCFSCLVLSCHLVVVVLTISQVCHTTFLPHQGALVSATIFNISS